MKQLYCLILQILLDSPPQQVSKWDENHWFFNRLIVDKEVRGKGIATFLMQELVKILDEKEITLLNEINPYGDLNRKQLQDFYSKFGFAKVTKGYYKGFYVRYPLNERVYENA